MSEVLDELLPNIVSEVQSNDPFLQKRGVYFLTRISDASDIDMDELAAALNTAGVLPLLVDTLNVSSSSATPADSRALEVLRLINNLSKSEDGCTILLSHDAYDAVDRLLHFDGLADKNSSDNKASEGFVIAALGVLASAVRADCSDDLDVFARLLATGAVERVTAAARARFAAPRHSSLALLTALAEAVMAIVRFMPRDDPELAHLPLEAAKLALVPGRDGENAACDDAGLEHNDGRWDWRALCLQTLAHAAARWGEDIEPFYLALVDDELRERCMRVFMQRLPTRDAALHIFSSVTGSFSTEGILSIVTEDVLAAFASVLGPGIAVAQARSDAQSYDDDAAVPTTLTHGAMCSAEGSRHAMELASNMITQYDLREPLFDSKFISAVFAAVPRIRSPARWGPGPKAALQAASWVALNCCSGPVRKLRLVALHFAGTGVGALLAWALDAALRGVELDTASLTRVAEAMLRAAPLLGRGGFDEFAAAGGMPLLLRGAELEQDGFSGNSELTQLLEKLHRVITVAPRFE